MAYIGNSPGVASQRVVTIITATSGQTTFAAESGYSIGYVDVILNGVDLVAGVDYTASDGVNVVLTDPAVVGDTVKLVSFIPRGLTDGYLKSETDALLDTKQDTIPFEIVSKTYVDDIATARYTKTETDTLLDTKQDTIPFEIVSKTYVDAIAKNGTLTVATSGVGLSGSGTFSANQDTNATITVTSNATSANTANAIVSRDANGDFSARIVSATATSARYADLAEKYSTEEEYPVGTVVVVSGSLNSECVKSYAHGLVCVGVISENPAYLMNKDAVGQAVALKGRVPVRVIGPVRKGQTIMSSLDGLAQVGDTNIIGVALETNLSVVEKYVECFIK
jgi:hypothetical protein